MDQNQIFQLLTLLEQDGQLTSKDLSRLLGVDQALVEKTIKDLEDKKIIGGYVTLVNWEKADEDKVSAMIEVRVTPQRGHGFEKIAQEIYNFPEVDSLYLMSGAFDFMILTRSATMREIASFVNRLAFLEGVLSTSTHVVLECYKSHGHLLRTSNQGKDRLLVS